MTDVTKRFGTFLAVAGLSLLCLQCGDKDDKTEPGTSGAGTEGGGTPQAPAKPEGTPKLPDLADQMVGYWLPDAAAMSEIIREQAASNPAAAPMLPMLLEMLESMAVEVREGKVTIHSMGQQRDSTFEVTDSDPASNTLTLKLTDPEDDSKSGTAVIEGDRLTLKKDGEGLGKILILDRTDEETFAKRRHSAPPDDSLPGIPPGDGPLPAPTPPPAPTPGPDQ